MGHGRRQLLWFAVTRHPTAEWLAQQIVEAFPWDTVPTYVIRGMSSYGDLHVPIRAMGIRDRPISPRSPWQNAYVERLIGTLRRDCLDHVLIFGEAGFATRSDHLLHLLQRDAHASRIVERHSPAPTCPAIRSYRRCANPVRAELEQLAMNARGAPKPVLNAHSSDQRPQTGIDPRPTSRIARFPAPITAHAGTMPAQERLGPDDHQWP